MKLAEPAQPEDVILKLIASGPCFRGVSRKADPHKRLSDSRIKTAVLQNCLKADWRTPPNHIDKVSSSLLCNKSSGHQGSLYCSVSQKARSPSCEKLDGVFPPRICDNGSPSSATKNTIEHTPAIEDRSPSDKAPRPKREAQNVQWSKNLADGSSPFECECCSPNNQKAPTDHSMITKSAAAAQVHKSASGGPPLSVSNRKSYAKTVGIPQQYQEGEIRSRMVDNKNTEHMNTNNVADLHHSPRTSQAKGKPNSVNLIPNFRDDEVVTFSPSSPVVSSKYVPQTSPFQEHMLWSPLNGGGGSGQQHSGGDHIQREDCNNNTLPFKKHSVSATSSPQSSSSADIFPEKETSPVSSPFNLEDAFMFVNNLNSVSTTAGGPPEQILRKSDKSFGGIVSETAPRRGTDLPFPTNSVVSANMAIVTTTQNSTVKQYSMRNSNNSQFSEYGDNKVSPDTPPSNGARNEVSQVLEWANQIGQRPSRQQTTGGSTLHSRKQERPSQPTRNLSKEVQECVNYTSLILRDTENKTTFSSVGGGEPVGCPSKMKKKHIVPNNHRPRPNTRAATGVLRDIHSSTRLRPHLNNKDHTSQQRHLQRVTSKRGSNDVGRSDSESPSSPGDETTQPEYDPFNKVDSRSWVTEEEDILLEEHQVLMGGGSHESGSSNKINNTSVPSYNVSASSPNDGGEFISEGSRSSPPTSSVANQQEHSSTLAKLLQRDEAPTEEDTMSDVPRCVFGFGRQEARVRKARKTKNKELLSAIHGKEHTKNAPLGIGETVVGSAVRDASHHSDDYNGSEDRRKKRFIFNLFSKVKKDERDDNGTDNHTSVTSHSPSRSSYQNLRANGSRTENDENGNGPPSSIVDIRSLTRLPPSLLPEPKLPPQHRLGDGNNLEGHRHHSQPLLSKSVFEFGHSNAPSAPADDGSEKFLRSQYKMKGVSPFEDTSNSTFLATNRDSSTLNYSNSQMPTSESLVLFRVLKEYSSKSPKRSALDRHAASLSSTSDLSAHDLRSASGGGITILPAAKQPSTNSYPAMREDARTVSNQAQAVMSTNSHHLPGIAYNSYPYPKVGILDSSIKHDLNSDSFGALLRETQSILSEKDAQMRTLSSSVGQLQETLESQRSQFMRERDTLIQEAEIERHRFTRNLKQLEEELVQSKREAQKAAWAHSQERKAIKLRCDELEENIERWQRTFGRYEGHLRAKEEQLESAEHEVSVLRKSLDERENDISNLTKQLSGVESKCDELSESLQTIQKEREKTCSNPKGACEEKLKSLLEEHAQAIEKLKSKLASELQSNETHWDNVVSNLKNVLAESQAMNEVRSEELKCSKVELENLEKTIESVRKELVMESECRSEIQKRYEEKVKSLEECETEKGRLRSDCEDMARILQKTKKQYDTLRKKNVSIEEYEKLQQKHRASVVDLDALMTQHTKKESELETIRKEVMALNQKLAVAENTSCENLMAAQLKSKMLEEQTSYLTKLRERVSTIEDELDEHRITSKYNEEQLTNKLEQERKRADELQNKLNSFLNEHKPEAELSSNIHQLRQQLQEAQNELDEKCATLDFVVQELDSLKHDRDREREKLQQETNQVVQSIREEHERKTQELNSMYKQLAQKNDDLEIQNLTRETAALSQQLSERDAEIDELLTELENVKQTAAGRLREIVKDLSKTDSQSH